MNRMAGEGALFFRTGGWVFTVVDLAGDAGYFREGAVFALEEAVIFENGRVPSRHSRDLDLVHLRGRGRMLLRTAGAPVAIEVSGDRIAARAPRGAGGLDGRRHAAHRPARRRGRGGGRRSRRPALR